MKKGLLDIKIPWYKRRLPSLNEYIEYYKGIKTPESIKRVYENHVTKFFIMYSRKSELWKEEKDNYIELLKKQINIKDFNNYTIENFEQFIKKHPKMKFEDAIDEMYKKVRDLKFYLIQNNF